MESSAEFVSSKGNYETSRSSSSSSCQLTTSASQSFKADFGPLRRELEALSFTAQSHQSLDYLANIAPAAEGQPDSSRAQTPPPPIPPRPLYYKKAYSIASTSSSLPDVSDSSVNLIKNSSSQETIFTTEEVAGEDLCFDTSDPILFQKHHHNKLPSQSSQRTFIDKPDPSLIEMESSGIVTAAATNSTTPSSSPSKLNRLAGRLRDSFKQQSGENSPQSKNRTASSSSASTTTTNSNAPQSSNQLQVEIDKLMAAPVSLATQRKCTMNQVYFLDYYFDLLTYLSKRKSRLEKFKQEMSMTMTTAGSSAEETQREWKTFFGKERAHLRKRRTRMTIMHFHIERQVGQGGYGQVFLARKKDTNEACALKKMSKEMLYKLGEVQHILTERDILSRSNTPWLVKLLYSFQDSQSVYLAMEFVPGGDMRTLLNNSGVLKEEYARFYIAEMSMGVAEVHRLGFIHRDLKPENFLIDATGHLKLTDFGLSRGAVSPDLIESLRNRLKRVKESPLMYKSTNERKNIYKTVKRDDMMRAFSLVGSPDYMAPEVLMNDESGYDLSVDYWSLGCILYEMLSGYPPFTAGTNDEIWVNVYHWKRVLERPVYTGEDEEFNLTNEAWDLVTSLIDDRNNRICSLSHLSSHAMFTSPRQDQGAAISDFMLLRNSVERGGAAPPLVPTLKSETDTSYFDDFDDPADMEMYKDVKNRQEALEREVEIRNLKEAKVVDGSSSNSSGLRTAFIGFTYKHRAGNKTLL